MLLAHTDGPSASVLEALSAIARRPDVAVPVFDAQTIERFYHVLVEAQFETVVRMIGGTGRHTLPQPPFETENARMSRLEQVRRIGVIEDREQPHRKEHGLPHELVETRKRLRRHADDGEIGDADSDRPADDRRVAVEVGPPDSIGQDDDPGGVPSETSCAWNPRPIGSGTPRTLKKLSLMKDATRTRGGSPGRSVIPTVP